MPSTLQKANSTKVQFVKYVHHVEGRLPNPSPAGHMPRHAQQVACLHARGILNWEGLACGALKGQSDCKEQQLDASQAQQAGLAQPIGGHLQGSMHVGACTLGDGAMEESKS